MADEKTIHIKITDAGDFSGGDNGESAEAREAREKAALMDKLVSKVAIVSSNDMDYTEIKEKKKEEKVKGKVGRPRKNPDPGDDGPKQPASKFSKILAGAQKTVIAFNGTNGRATKAMALFTRVVGSFTKPGNTFAQGLFRLATVGGIVSKALLGVGVFAAGAGATLIGLGVGAVILGKIFVRVSDSLQKVAGEFSGALNVAKARSNIGQIQEQMRAATQVGGELAVMEESSNVIRVEMNKLWTNFADTFSGPITAILDISGKILEAINVILGWLNMFFEWLNDIAIQILTVLENLPLIGRLYGAIKDWLEKDKVKEAEGAADIGAQLDPLGLPANIGLDVSQGSFVRRNNFIPKDM